MPTEIIGEFGTPGTTSEWIEAQGKLAIRHFKKVCGNPPPKMELEIVWQEHELGRYPVIGLVWDDPMRELKPMTPYLIIRSSVAQKRAVSNEVI